MTFDFMHDWGVLNYASGHVMCSWFARDTDDLASARGGRRSVAPHKRDRHKLAVARLMLPLLDQGISRKQADLMLAEKIKSAIAENIAVPPLVPSELSELLNKKRRLKTTYDARKFTRNHMEALVQGNR